MKNKKGRLAIIILWFTMGCAPVYYGSIVYDVETTLACRNCTEANPVVFVDISNRLALYTYSIVYATAFTFLVEKTEHEKLFYTIATVAHVIVATLNLRYVKY